MKRTQYYFLVFLIFMGCGGGEDKTTSSQSVANETTADSSIVLPPPPQQFRFEVLNTYPHDPSAYTQGLQYLDGVVYESTGLRGQSTLRKVDLETGEVMQSVQLDDRLFGEGITVVDDKIIMLTYRENTGLIYDRDNLELMKSFTYPKSREGWGLTYNGEQLIMSDGTSSIYFLNVDSLQDEKVINIHDNNGPVDMINELEYIDGRIYANIYQQDYIVVINPETGVVESRINLIGLYNHEAIDNELNGIAYNPENESLFVTGKRWTKLFEVKAVE